MGLLDDDTYRFLGGSSSDGNGSSSRPSGIAGLLGPNARGSGGGLLDGISPDAQLGIGLLAAAGPSMQPMGFGQRLAQGFQYVNDQRMNQQKLKTGDLQYQMITQQLAAATRKNQLINDALSQANGAGKPGGVGPDSMGQDTAAGGAGSTTANTQSVQPSAAPGGLFAGLDRSTLATDLAFNNGEHISSYMNDRTKPNWQNVNGNMVNVNAPGFNGGIQPGMSVSASGDMLGWDVGTDGKPVAYNPKGAVGAKLAQQAGQTLTVDLPNNTKATLNPEEWAAYTQNGTIPARFQSTMPAAQPTKSLLQNVGNANVRPDVQALIAADAQKNGIKNPFMNLNTPVAGQTLGLTNPGSLMPASQGAPMMAQGSPDTVPPTPGSAPMTFGLSKSPEATAVDMAKIETDKAANLGAITSGQKYVDNLHDIVGNEFQLVNRNKQILPLLDQYKTGGFAPEQRLHFANAIANTDYLPADFRNSMAAKIAGGSPIAGKVIENQIASAAITTMLDTLNKEGKPNRAIFQALQQAQEGLQSGNTTLKDVFAIQQRLYDIHYNEQQVLTAAQKDKTYNPQTWAGDYSRIRNQDLQTPASPLPSVAPGKPNVLDTMPTPNGSNKGQRIRDTQTGKVFMSNGLQWKEVN